MKKKKIIIIVIAVVLGLSILSALFNDDEDTVSDPVETTSSDVDRSFNSLELLDSSEEPAHEESAAEEPVVEEPVVEEPVAEYPFAEDPVVEEPVVSIQPVSPSPEPSSDRTVSQESQSVTYVLNTNTQKIHLQSCRYTSRITEENKSFTTDPDYYLSLGYTWCDVCH